MKRARDIGGVVFLLLLGIAPWAVGSTPINDLGSGLYLGQYQGGLYPGGSNAVPAGHAAAGLARAAAIGPLDVNGNPNPTGRSVLVSIGMSNTTQEWLSQNSLLPAIPGSLMDRAASNAAVNHSTLAIIDGAQGGRAANSWISSSSPTYDWIVSNWLTPNGLSEKQVQAAWLKVADAQPTVALPNSNADAFVLEQEMGQIARAMKVRYPNLKEVFVSSRIYAGYATSTLNPEPYAYESGFAVKWLIQAQINQENGLGIDPIAGDLNDNNGTAPWLAWGPYLWADGTNPRSDGLTWVTTDFQSDGTHPSPGSGVPKVGAQLMNFFDTSPFTQPWFTVPEPGAGFLIAVGLGFLMRRRRR